MARPVGDTRERLLRAADDLFYAEGVQSVGIDRIIAAAGVAKASLYRTFGSKEDLVAAYLDARHERAMGRYTTAVEAAGTPRDRLLAVLEAQADWISGRHYIGCPFARAAAEAPADGRVMASILSYRADVLRLLTRLAGEAGVADPAGLAMQLNTLVHGSAAVVEPDNRAAVAAAIRRAAATLIDAG